MLPFASQRARSPVLYMREPATVLNESGKNLSAVRSGRFKYPLPTLCPPMKISPGAPTVTGSRCGSRMYTFVPARGLPMEGLECGPMTHEVASTVHSVGPYTLWHSFDLRAPSISHTCSGTGYPPSRRLVESEAFIDPASKSSFTLVGEQ